ncbi:MAG: hypothetical protein IKI64_11680 [Clostridia bacterium]|nr:hypothetical protein [Clostridia bacterium]
MRKTVSFLLLAAMLLLLVMLPKYASGLLSAHDPLEYFRPHKEAYSGTISIWHAVGFKPYSGSMGAWLEKYAKRIEKRHFGVFFDLKAMSAEEARTRIGKGEFPDIISFPAGLLQGSELRPMQLEAGEPDAVGGEKAPKAIPLAASCELILYCPDSTELPESGPSEEMAREFTFEQFKLGKAPCCICDVRGAGDMQRLLERNKAKLFSVMPFKTDTELVQYLGISQALSEEKEQYARELLELLMSSSAQNELAELGLLPLALTDEAEFEQSFLDEAYSLILENSGVITAPFKRAQPFEWNNGSEK